MVKTINWQISNISICFRKLMVPDHLDHIDSMLNVSNKVVIKYIEKQNVAKF